MIGRVPGSFVSLLAWIAMSSALIAGQPAAAPADSAAAAFAGPFRWTATPPLVSPAPADGESWHSMKDPSIVRADGRWHLFCTARGTKRTHSVLHASFAEWKDAGQAERHALGCHGGYFCAPQVFYFTPQKKWYLICQASDESWDPKYQPAWSTTDDVGAPGSWSPLKPLFGKQPEGIKAWLDFWVICDGAKAHLFHTSLDGKMWRSETRKEDFPGGWSRPLLALEGDVFEASHTYRLQGSGSYLTLIEAQGGHGWRYYKAYTADRLDGEWKPIAAGKDDAFASMSNVTQPAKRWTDSVSHGELLRAGIDERLEVDPKDLRFLFQGVLDADRQGKSYGEIPWRLGLLERSP